MGERPEPPRSASGTAGTRSTADAGAGAGTGSTADRAADRSGTADTGTDSTTDRSAGSDPTADRTADGSTSAGPELGAWWDAVSTCALVGTARRPVPQPLRALIAALGHAGRARTTPGPGADERPDDPTPHVHPETRLLDEIAIGVAWRSGVPEPVAPERLEPAPEETLPLAPPRALQLLDLVLAQAPAGAGATEVLVADWVAAAREHGMRVPPALVPALLDHALRHTPAATRRPGSAEARAAVLAVTGERGRWLAALVPQWQGVLPASASLSPARRTAPGDAGSPEEQTHGAGDVDGAPDLPEDWLQLSLPEQIAHLSRLRRVAPERAGEAVAEGYRSGSARERAAYLGVLSDGLGAADEELLERALSDRAGGVREEAARLLERLPGSARAARMGERLRPLIAVSSRLLRTRVSVLLPDPPDPAGVRDGLGKAPRGRSARGHHLTEIVAGAPLGIWREVTRLEPAKVVTALEDTDDVLPGLWRAAAAQRDPLWARALLDHGPLHPALLAVLDPREAEQLVGERLRGASAREGTLVLEQIPGPWGPGLSGAALDLIERIRPVESAATTITAIGARLHPEVLPALRATVERMPFGAARDRASRVVTLATLRQSISEAFT